MFFKTGQDKSELSPHALSTDYFSTDLFAVFHDILQIERPASLGTIGGGDRVEASVRFYLFFVSSIRVYVNNGTNLRQKINDLSAESNYRS